MLNLLGEYGCKVDAKGRLMFPAKLRKQLEQVLHHGLVLNRDIFEKCLVLYPKPEWDRVNTEMSRLSRYNRQHQQFQRKFMKGATLIELDGTGRMLIPSSLMTYAGIEPTGDNEVIITGVLEKIELWNARSYDEQVLNDDDDFGDLADGIRKQIEGPGNLPLN
jgi:MraZ protein